MKSSGTILYATEALGERVSEYSEAHSLSLPKELTEYHARVVEEEPDRANIMISPFQSQCMIWLAHLTGAKRVLEIGVFLGYSCMVWSHAVGPEGKVTGLEFDADYAKRAGTALVENGFRNCDIHVGDALEKLPTLVPDESYDIIFIDAQKSGYPAYLSTILANSPPAASDEPSTTIVRGNGNDNDEKKQSKRLLRAGGLIIADNALRCGLVACERENPFAAAEMTNTSPYWRSEDIRCLREFNDAVKKNSGEGGRLESFMCPLWDGVNLIRLRD